MQSIGSVTLDLPPATAWATRTETLSVLGSTNGTTFSQIVGSAGYTFNPRTGNTVTISLPSGTSAQYVELSFTANTGWPAAQLSELEVFPGTGGGGSGPGSALTASPSSLSFASTTVELGQRSADGDGVQPQQHRRLGLPAGRHRPVRADHHLRRLDRGERSCTVAITFDPTAAGAATGSLTVASSAAGSPLTVGLSGTGHPHHHRPGPQRAGHRVQLQPDLRPRQRRRRQHQHLLGSHRRRLAQHHHRQPRSAQTLGSITVDLPPSSAWSTRPRPCRSSAPPTALRSATIVGSAAYTWNPSTGNTVTIRLPAGTSAQYVSSATPPTMSRTAPRPSEILDL